MDEILTHLDASGREAVGTVLRAMVASTTTATATTTTTTSSSSTTTAAAAAAAHPSNHSLTGLVSGLGSGSGQATQAIGAALAGRQTTGTETWTEGQGQGQGASKGEKEGSTGLVSGLEGVGEGEGEGEGFSEMHNLLARIVRKEEDLSFDDVVSVGAETPSRPSSYSEAVKNADTDIKTDLQASQSDTDALVWAKAVLAGGGGQYETVLVILQDLAATELEEAFDHIDVVVKEKDTSIVIVDGENVR